MTSCGMPRRQLRCYAGRDIKQHSFSSTHLLLLPLFRIFSIRRLRAMPSVAKSVTKLFLLWVLRSCNLAFFHKGVDTTVKSLPAFSPSRLLYRRKQNRNRLAHYFALA